jgi:hypothetical protein
VHWGSGACPGLSIVPISIFPGVHPAPPFRLRDSRTPASGWIAHGHTCATQLQPPPTAQSAAGRSGIGTILPVPVSSTRRQAAALCSVSSVLGTVAPPASIRLGRTNRIHLDGACGKRAQTHSRSPFRSSADPWIPRRIQCNIYNRNLAPACVLPSRRQTVTQCCAVSCAAVPRSRVQCGSMAPLLLRALIRRGGPARYF